MSSGHDLFNSAARVRRVILVAITVGAVLCALTLQTHAWAIAAAGMAALMLGIMGPWIAVRCVRVTLDRLPERAGQYSERFVDGEKPVLSARVKSLFGRFAPAVRLRAGGLIDWPIAVAGTDERVSIDIGPLRRGIYDLSDVFQISTWPFGLRLCERRLPTSGKLIVWPAEKQPLSWPVLQASAAVSPIPANVAIRVGSDGDPLSTRAYRRGDSLRQVHWAQTARHDRLIVRERQANDPPLATLFIHTRSDHYASDHHFEQTLRVAAALLKRWSLDAHDVQLTAGGKTLTSAGGRSAHGVMMDLLAGLSLASDNVAQGTADVKPASIVLPDPRYGRDE